MTANRILAGYPGINGSTGIPCLVNEWIELAATEFALSALDIAGSFSLITRGVSLVRKILVHYLAYPMWKYASYARVCVCVVVQCYLHFKLQTVGNVERIL